MSVMTRFTLLGTVGLFTLSLAAIHLAVANRPQTPLANRADAIDRIIREQVPSTGPGAAVLVAIDGQTVFARSYGMANLKTNEPISPTTKFELASVSKQFTAMAVMILSDRGLLRFDDRADKYLPELPVYDPRRPILIRDLLHHTSGLPEYFDFDRASAHPGMSANERVLRELGSHPLEFATGSKFEYTNTNYALLALIVERASGKRFRDFLTDEIFTPLAMTHSFVLDDRKISLPHVALGYARDARGFHEVTSENLVVGDGGIWSNLEDMARRDQGLREFKLVAPATMARAYTPARLDDGTTEPYGFGWVLERGSGRQTWAGHAGQWSGYSTYISRDLDTPLSIIILSNIDDLDPVAIAEPIRRLYVNKPELPKP